MWRPRSARQAGSCGAKEIEGSDYASGRAAYQAKARSAIGDQLARLERPMSLTALKAMVAQ